MTRKAKIQHLFSDIELQSESTQYLIPVVVEDFDTDEIFPDDEKTTPEHSSVVSF